MMPGFLAEDQALGRLQDLPALRTMIQNRTPQRCAPAALKPESESKQRLSKFGSALTPEPVPSQWFVYERRKRSYMSVLHLTRSPLSRIWGGDQPRDGPCVNLLKCLCQTESPKPMRWHTATTRNGKIPGYFETRSKVMLIANDWTTKNEAVRALQDRATCMYFDPSPEEIHRHVATWFDDPVVFDWMASRLPLLKSPSIRQYLKASELRRSGLSNWEKIADDQLDICRKTACVIRLEKSDLTIDDRVKSFAEAGHGSRATYFRFKKRVVARAKHIPKIKLAKAKSKRRMAQA